MPNIERRNTVQEVRASGDGETPTISGYASVFDSPYDAGWWTEIVDAHAFDSVLAKNPDVRGLFNHDESMVLGRTTAGTLSLSIDARGLAYEILPPDTTFARDLLVSIRRKDITQSSFAFICKRDAWVDNADGTITRTILELSDLLDVSPVTFPASPAASVTLRNLPDTMPREMRSRLEQRAESPCLCGCPQCVAGACGICSSTPPCIGAKRSSSAISDSDRYRMEMQLALASR